MLERLRDETGESVQLFVRSGDGRLCVESLESAHGLRWIVPVGRVLPLDRGSAGRVLERRVVRRAGVVESVEERERGVASVSAAVRGPLRRGGGGGERVGPDRAAHPRAGGALRERCGWRRPGRSRPPSR